VPDEISDRSLLVLFSELLTFNAATKTLIHQRRNNVRHSLTYATTH